MASELWKTERGSRVKRVKNRSLGRGSDGNQSIPSVSLLIFTIRWSKIRTEEEKTPTEIGLLLFLVGRSRISKKNASD